MKQNRAYPSSTLSLVGGIPGWGRREPQLCFRSSHLVDLPECKHHLLALAAMEEKEP